MFNSPLAEWLEGSSVWLLSDREKSVSSNLLYFDYIFIFIMAQVVTEADARADNV